MPRRYLLIFGTFLLSMLLYVDRVCISAAKDAVAGDLRFDDTQMGWIFASFSLGYALFQTPGGLLADRFEPRRILAAVVCFWSLLTALTGAVWNLVSMLVVRFLFGVGQAGAFPGVARAVYSWLPMSERGLTQGINFSASRLGAAFALPGVAWMVEQFGWRTSFVILGAVGFVWAAGWFHWFRDDPASHPGLTETEREFILQNRQQAFHQEGGAKLSAGIMLRSVNMWLLMGQYFASNFTFYFCLTWMLPHLSGQYGLTPTQAGGLAMPVFFAGMAGNFLGGSLVDAIYRRGRWTSSRRLPAMIGFALAAGGMLGSLYMNDPVSVVVCLSVAILGADMTLSPSWSLCIDIGRRNAGAVSGTMNMAGNLGSFVTALAFPYFLEWTDSTATFFLVGAGLNLLGLTAWQFTHADRALEEY